MSYSATDLFALNPAQQAKHVRTRLIKDNNMNTIACFQWNMYLIRNSDVMDLNRDIALHMLLGFKAMYEEEDTENKLLHTLPEFARLRESAIKRIRCDIETLEQSIDSTGMSC